MRRNDLTGKTFGQWEVKEYLGNKKYLCRCSCGVEKEVSAYKLTSGQSTSCGHLKNKFIDLTNKQFNDWTVIKYVGDHKWLCRCSCGVEKEVSSINLRYGRSTSCGHSTTGFKNIEGQQFGDWKALKYAGNTLWECECQCENKTHRLVKLYDLEHGRTTSCGHNTTGFIDLTNKQFSELTVKKYVGDQKWLCECSCGHYKIVKGQKLRSGLTKSCGCKILEKIKQYNLENYGTEFNGQRHRTASDIAVTESRDSMLNYIKTNWDTKPTATELGETIILQMSRTLKYIHKYNLEDYIDLKPVVSSYEKEIASLFPCSHPSDRQALNGKEIDLYYPEYKFGIEVNGTYWHSTIYKNIEYHQDKSIQASKLGIQLIHIFEYEWKDEDTRRKLISLIDRKLNTNITKIYARDCEIKAVDRQSEIEFLTKYHLQNYTTSSIQYGCYYRDELIGIMTFGAPRFNSEYQYELIRLCWKEDIEVIGGTERLFKHFIKDHKPVSIITYCDISKFNGNIYKRLGFRLEEITKPNYKWVNTKLNDVKTRYQTQKSRLVKMGLGGVDETETEIMERLNYLKIYDCGNYKYTWEGNKDSDRI